MQFEVEKKYWLPDIDGLLLRLEQARLAVGPAVDQIDKYFAHPSRDFVQTDEILRLRMVGDENYLTYKGARIDSTTKTRREMELPLLPGDYAIQFEQLLAVLGFEPLMTIHKSRRKANCTRGDREIEISIDEIDQLGSFVELETTSDLEHLDQAKSALQGLADELQLDRQERRSYLELMLHQLSPNRFSA